MELEKLVFVDQFATIRSVVMEGSPDAHNVFLKVTNQEFCVSKYGCETLEEAEWMQSMLCVALRRIIQEWEKASACAETVPIFNEDPDVA